MHRFKKIFVAIDFSPASDEALRQAHQRAVSGDANLAVCHIIPNELRSNLLFPQFSRDTALSVPVEVERISENVSNRVADITGRINKDVTIIVDHGTPYAEILKAAEDWDADLIVMGSRGMTGAAGILLGSVTHRVIRYAHATVLIVRSGSTEGGIVAGTDFSDPALPAISTAVDEARRTNSALTLVHSIEPALAVPSHGAVVVGGSVTLSDEGYSLLKCDAENRLREALKKFDADAEGEIVVAMGPPSTSLVTIVEERHASLLVVGTKGGTGLARVLLGSVAETVASEAPCSVMITRLH